VSDRDELIRELCERIARLEAKIEMLCRDVQSLKRWVFGSVVAFITILTPILVVS